MTDQEALRQIRAIADTQLSGGGTSPTPQPTPAPAVTSKPAPFADLGSNSGAVESQVSAGQPFGVTFTVLASSSGFGHERSLKWFGSPGQFWSRNSWAIFDSAGNRVLFADDQVVVGTLGAAVPPEVMALLGAGTYSLGVALNGSGNIAMQFVQN